MRCLRWSPNGKWLATADGGIGVHIWSTDTWNEIKFVETHGKGALSIAFSSDCRYLALGGYLGELTILETDHFRELQRTHLPHQIGSLQFGHRHELLVGGLTGEVTVFQYSGPRKLWASARREQISASKAAIRSLAFSAVDNRIYVLSREERAIRIQSQIAFIGCDATRPLPIPVGMVAESKLVLDSDEKGFNAKLRHVDTNRIEWTVSDPILRSCLPVYSARRELVILACTSKNESIVYLFRRRDGELIARLPFPVDGLSLSRDSKYLVGGGWSGQVRVWDLDTLDFIDLPYGQGEFEAVAKFSPNDDLLVVGPAGTRSLTCLRTGTWETIREANTTSNWGTFEFSRSINSLIVGESGKISAWDSDLKSRQWSAAFGGIEGHDKVFSLTLTPDESTVVGYIGQTAIRFWDRKTRSELFSQTIPRGGAEWLSFADPNTLHVDASDGWYVLSGKPIERKTVAE
ncbi:MAG: WD40 repeat domain-containing protein [Pirellula sp.]